MKSTKVLIRDIYQDYDIYPRFKESADRIDHFVELLECGNDLPPVIISRDSDKYILLDGAHRLGAYHKLGKEQVEAVIMDVDSKYFRLVSAGLNTVSSMPLNRKELQNVIKKAWVVDGVKSVKEIAKRLQCSEQYVRRVLKPIRDKEKREKKQKVLDLHEQGMNEKEISEKLGVARPTVYRYLNEAKSVQNETVSFWTKSDSQKSSEYPSQSNLQSVDNNNSFSYELNINKAQESEKGFDKNKDIRVGSASEGNDLRPTSAGNLDLIEMDNSKKMESFPESVSIMEEKIDVSVGSNTKDEPDFKKYFDLDSYDIRNHDMSLDFKVAFENMIGAIRRAKQSAWKNTSKETVLACIQILYNFTCLEEH